MPPIFLTLEWLAFDVINSSTCSEVHVEVWKIYHRKSICQVETPVSMEIYFVSLLKIL